MLLVQEIRNDKEAALERLAVKNFKDLDLVDEILARDDERKKMQQESDNILAKINQLSKDVGKLFSEGKRDEANKLKNESSSLKETSKELVEKVNKAEKEVQELLVRLPNLPHTSVPKGKIPEDNEVRFQVKELPKLIDNARPHWELIEQYKIIDFELGTKITGAGFPVYRGKGAKLQRALIQFFLDEAIAAGYEEIMSPLLVNEDSAFGTGQLPDKEGQMYEMKADPFYLIPTAEVPVTNIYRDVILTEEELPKQLTGYTPCFRREAGSYGKDVRGLNRLHQFDKVEIVQLAHPDKSYEILEEMVSHVEGLLKKLELPYRILRLCGGDMSFASALTYDFEVWSGAQQKWLEVSSASNFESFQSNRMKIRFKDKGKKTRLVHTLNGSALALPRIVAALLENNQTADGINLPKVLHSYTGFTTIN